MQDNLTLLHANIKGTDKPAHPCSLISAIVIRYLKIVVIFVVKLAPCEISIF